MKGPVLLFDRPAVGLLLCPAQGLSAQNLADEPNYARQVRDYNTDRITGVPFTSKIPPLRDVDVPPTGERWGIRGP